MQGEVHVKMEAITGLMCLQIKDCWPPPWEAGVDEDDPLWILQSELSLVSTLTLDAWLPELERIHPCCFKLSCLWCFVMRSQETNTLVKVTFLPGKVTMCFLYLSVYIKG